MKISFRNSLLDDPVYFKLLYYFLYSYSIKICDLSLCDIDKTNIIPDQTDGSSIRKYDVFCR